MLPAADYVRAARYMIARNGIDALDRAQSRAEALRGHGDVNCHRLWALLAATIAELTGAGRQPEPKGNFFTGPAPRA